MSDVTPVNFDPDAITLQDLEDLEDAFGLSLGQVMQTFHGKSQITFEDMSAKLISGIAFLAMRQFDPEVDAKSVKRMSLSKLMDMLAGASEKPKADPTDGG